MGYKNCRHVPSTVKTTKFGERRLRRGIQGYGCESAVIIHECMLKETFQTKRTLVPQNVSILDIRRENLQ